MDRKYNTGFQNDERTVEELFEIGMHLKDATSSEGQTVLFECKVGTAIGAACIWYKNGEVLRSDERTTITVDEQSACVWHRLKINRVNSTDQGLYLFESSYKTKHISSKARLFVVPHLIKDGAFYHRTDTVAVGVTKHLLDVQVIQGQKIELIASFNHISDEHVWYKNNELIVSDIRRSFKNYNNEASLTITDAKTTDTGFYFVVSKTITGYVSSCADVEVTERKEMLVILPMLMERLPYEVIVNEGEEMRITLRAWTDKDTVIEWTKDGSQIKDNDAVIVNYGDCYLGLKIPKCTRMSAGEYKVSLRNKQEKEAQAVNTVTIVTVGNPQKPLHKKRIVPAAVRLMRPLVSAVACCGGAVTFDCSFDIGDPIYFYVVWYIGHYRVERTNRLFSVVFSGSQSIIFIKNVEPSMSGQVICELRRAWPNQSVMVARTSARLDLAPLRVIEEGRLRLTTTCHSKLNYVHAVDSDNIYKHQLTPMVGNIASTAKNTSKTQILEIVYCRLDEDLCFLHASCSRDDVTSCLRVQNKTTSGNKTTILEWADSVLPSQWYRIELAQTDGSFALVGASSQPRFRLDSPALDRVMVFRIRSRNPISDVTDQEVSIAPPPETITRPKRSHRMLPAKDFFNIYISTKEVIGAGGFGSVILVRDKDSITHYAAKFVTKKTDKQWERIRREFDVMKRLQHPKLIELIGFYVLPPDKYVFVMEYCWGGDLFDRIVEEDHITELDVTFYVKQLCEGLEYMHLSGIIHLDMKPDNIICLSPNTRQVKLIDFGLAREVGHSSKNVIYGTRNYMSPEVLAFESITSASDMWSLGVVTYVMLSGVSPFAEDTMKCIANITSATFNFEEDAFDDVTELGKGFLEQLLVREPAQRMTATAALAHPWIAEGPPIGAIARHMNTTRANLKSYLADYKKRWQRAGNVMIAANRLRLPKREANDLPAPDQPIIPINLKAGNH